MNPVFGLGIAGEEQFSRLASTLPEEISFLEVPGELLDTPSAVSRLKKLSGRQKKALVIRDIMPSYLAEALPTSPLRLKVEFDGKFRSRCRTAAALGCRVVSVDFDLVKAMNDALYGKGLTGLLKSMSGTLEELELLLALPLDMTEASATSFLAFKHRLFYPGFRYRIDFRYGEEGYFEALDEAVKILDFERNFWRVPCRCGGDSRLSPEVMEKLRPYWERRSRTPVFVSLDAGTLPPDGELIEELTCLIRDFRSGKNEGGLC